MDWRKEGIAYGDSGYCGPLTSLINFAEGAFAIIATIDLPSLTSLPLVTAQGKLVPEEWQNYYPAILSAFLSFQFVCRARGRHVKVFDSVERSDDSLTLLSAIYLLLSSFIPFSVKATLTWGPENRIGGAHAFILFQLLFIALDLVSLATLFYTKRANLFYPTIVEPREDNMRVIMDEGATHRLHAQTKEARKARQGHFIALCAQFCLTILINLLLMPLGFSHWSAAMTATLLFSNLAMKSVVSAIPVFRNIFKRELGQPLNKARLNSYHDNVFSILATLLVLDVALPRRTNPDESFSHAIVTNSYLMIGFGVAFLFTLSYWMLHKQIFAHITGLSALWRQVDQTVIAVTCYVPFASLQASRAITIREDQSLYDCERQFATPRPMVLPDEDDVLGNITGNATATRDFAWQYNPVLMFYGVNLLAGLVFITFWLSLQRFKPQFLSKDETLVAWRPLVLAKCCVMPMVSVIGFGLSFLRPRKIGMFAVLATPVLWALAGRIAGVRIQKNTRTRVDRGATMTHVLVASIAFKRLLERRRRGTEEDPLQTPLLEEDEEAGDAVQLSTLAEESEDEQDTMGHGDGTALRDDDDVETGVRAQHQEARDASDGVANTGDSAMGESSM